MDNRLLTVVQIVRRFGRCGGMETYVWYLAHGLLRFGYRVVIVCEEVTESSIDPQLHVVTVERSNARRRYRQMQHFRERADTLLKSLVGERPKNSVLIHSHERSLNHQVTTFHGPPIGENITQSLLARMSPRLRAWSKMELHEVLGPSVRYVVPVSQLLSLKLAEVYPETGARLTPPGYPGVTAKAFNVRQDERLGFVFVGTEWKRKGLDLAIHWLSFLRRDGRTISLDVFGVKETDVPARLRKFHWVRFRGWSDDVPFSQYKVLVHPARKEPFGMVVPEALAAGCAVVISDQVGAKDLYAGYEQVLVGSLSDSMERWIERLKLACTQAPVNPLERLWSWDDLICFYHEQVYSNFFKAID